MAGDSFYTVPIYFRKCQNFKMASPRNFSSAIIKTDMPNYNFLTISRSIHLYSIMSQTKWPTQNGCRLLWQHPIATVWNRTVIEYAEPRFQNEVVCGAGWMHDKGGVQHNPRQRAIRPLFAISEFYLGVNKESMECDGRGRVPIKVIADTQTGHTDRQTQE